MANTLLSQKIIRKSHKSYNCDGCDFLLDSFGSIEEVIREIQNLSGLDKARLRFAKENHFRINEKEPYIREVWVDDTAREMYTLRYRPEIYKLFEKHNLWE